MSKIMKQNNFPGFTDKKMKS